MLDNGDQPFWTEAFLCLAREQKPDGVLIAGDVYDRAFPSGEATQLFSHLLTELAAADIPVLICAGNHDSVERLSFAAELLAKQKVFISRPLLESGGRLVHVTLEDEFGPVTVWLMPYLFPSLVSQALGTEPLHDTEEAVRKLLAAQEIDFSRRNVILAHQYVTENGQEPRRGGSESMVGGVGQIDYHAFDGFEYAALGHIHASYPVGRRGIRYAGSPLCYHFEETKQKKKGPLLVTLGKKGEEAETELMEIAPLHPMREMRGSLAELQQQEEQETRRNEYLRVVLTDRKNTAEISAYFNAQFDRRESRLLSISSEFQEFTGSVAGVNLRQVREKPLESLFMDFYSEKNEGQSPEEEDRELLIHLGEIARNADMAGEPTEKDVAAALAFLDEQEGKE